MYNSVKFSFKDLKQHKVKKEYPKLNISFSRAKEYM